MIIQVIKQSQLLTGSNVSVLGRYESVYSVAVGPKGLILFAPSRDAASLIGSIFPIMELNNKFKTVS